MCRVQDILYTLLAVWSEPVCGGLGKIDYKKLRKINPEAARKAVLEYLKTNKGNISQAASVFCISRCVVYNILRKEKEGDLRDRPRTPQR